MSTAVAAPYPPDTRAKGWRFELDYEKIDQSDTWALAAEVPMAQPALLMMWLVAWQQEPCGSLPNDENIIRAKCKVPPATWAKLRALLMRGWWLADDGRLYHKTITERVLSMLEKRASDAGRAAARRARKAESGESPPEVTDESRVTHTGQTREFDTKHQAPSTKHQAPTGSGETREAQGSRKADPPQAAVAAPPPKPPKIACPEGVDTAVWADWLTLRRAKRAPVTATVLEGARDEAAKAGMSLEAFLRVWCKRSSQGLEAAWLKPDERGAAGNGRGPPPTKAELDAINAEAMRLVRGQQEVIDHA